MISDMLRFVAAGIVLLLLTLFELPAQVLFSDGFEGYTASANPLDANIAGPNAGPNGGPGNPWFGPAPPNLRVAAGGISSGPAGPHSGNNLVTAIAPNDFDQEWVNIANRFNGGNPYFGNISFDWWFYDAGGAGNGNFRDFAALGYYSVAATAASSGLDYTAASGGNLNTGSVLQRLSLGAINTTVANAAQYQARVVGATDGPNAGQYFNLPVSRSIGWHEGKILLGAPNGAATMVSFYIDGVNLLNHAIDTPNGVNVIELNDGFGTVAANYDDVTLTIVPEPASAALLMCGGLVWLTSRRRK